MTDRPPSRDSSDESELRPVEKTGPTRPSFGQTEQQAAELAAMRRMLAASRGTFSLSIAVCNSPALRDYLVNKLLEDDADYVAVSMPRETENFLDYALGDLGSRTPSALFLVDLESSLPSDGPRPAIRLLNATREKWQQCFACPVILWMPEYAVKLLAAEARDFWAWRSHQFEFVAESVESTSGESAAFSGGLDDALNLDADRKQFRIAELRGRIDAAGDEPTPEMTAHVTTWLNELGNLLSALGDLDEAEKMLRKALEIEEKLGRLEGMGVLYNNLGLIFRMHGDLDEAENMQRRALEISEKLGRQEEIAGAYTNLANIYQTRGDLDDAEKMHRKSLEIFEKLGRLQGIALQYGNLGTIVRLRGDLDEAEKMVRKALEIDEKLGRLEGVARAYGNLGIIFQERGDLDKSEKMLRMALETNSKLGRLEGMAIQYGNLGSIFQARGALADAEEMHCKALEINEQVGDLEGVAIAKSNLGTLSKKRGDPDEARKLWTKARDLYTRIGIPHMVEKLQGWLDDLPKE